ncbi:MAG: response regulator [Desulfuromonadales bacterium]
MGLFTTYPISLLCVEDEPAVQEVLRRHLSTAVDTFYLAGNGQEGYDLFNEHRTDVVITDLMMPVLGGLAMSRMIRAAAPKTPIILMTSCSRADFMEEAIDIGITQFLPKPVLKEKLLTALQRCHHIIELERRSSRAIKLESLELVAGGVAHSFNNILTAILGNVQYALQHLPQDSITYHSILQAEEAANRAAEIAKQMLDYTAKGWFKARKIDLNTLVEQVRRSLMERLPSGISLSLDVEASLPPIKGELSQLSQVIISLVENSLDAIGEINGKITISTGIMECDSSYIESCWHSNDLQPGNYVFLEVSDTGCGMEKGSLDKLFDPFFSTKFTGRGMGLAAVLGIVRWHKGAIHITSKPGAGSTFRIILPFLPKTLPEETEECKTVTT